MIIKGLLIYIWTCILTIGWVLHLINFNSSNNFKLIILQFGLIKASLTIKLIDNALNPKSNNWNTKNWIIEIGRKYPNKVPFTWLSKIKNRGT